jgi:glutaredoxin
MKVPARSIGVLLLLVLAASAGMQVWHGSAERRQAERLAVLAQTGDIRMLSSVTCVYCEAARRTMTRHGVRFDECFIERDPNCQALYAGSGARGTPTLLVRGRVLVGFDVRRLVETLERG